MALTKVSGGILDPGINVAGIVTATGFDGPFIGGSSKNIVAGIITATGLDVNGNGDISGLLTAGSANFTGNVSIGGTLTYEDVKNVDSVGVITARSGINVIGHSELDNLNVSGVSTFTGNIDANGGLDVAGTSTFSGIATASSTLFAKNFSTSGIGTFADIHVKNPVDTRITSIAPGAIILSRDTPVILFKNNLSDSFDASIDVVSNELRFKGGGNNATSTRMVTTSSGVSFPQNIDVDGQTHLDDVSVSGVSTFAGNIKQTAPGSNTAKITLNNASDTTGMDVGYSESSGVGFINVGQSGSGLSIKTGGLAAGNERLRITSDGEILIGHDTSRDVFKETQVQISGANGDDAGLSIYSTENGNAGPNLILAHSRGGNAVTNNSVLGDITFVGHDGTDLNSRASVIRSTMTANGTNNSLYADLIFYTKRNAGGYPDESLRITSDGKLLLGTTDSGFSGSYTTMTIGNTSTQNTGLTIASSASNGYSRLHFADANSGAAVYAGFIAYSHANDALLMGTNNSGTEKLRITSGGQLLISGNTGWNESSSLLSISTDAAAGANMLSDSSAIYNHNNPAFIHVQNRYNTGTGQEAGIILHSKSSYNGSWAIYSKRTSTNYYADLLFRCRTGNGASRERLHLHGNGDITFNNCSTTIDSSNYGMYLLNDSNTTKSVFLRQSREANGTHSSAEFYGNQGAMKIYGDGDVKNTNNSYGQLSDETLKQDIVDASSQWDDIKAIKVRKFRFKDNPTGVLQIGVIAQELETVSPKLVTEVATSSDDLTSTETVKAVKYSVLYMKAIKALQEAQTRIETLEAKVSALEGS